MDEKTTTGNSSPLVDVSDFTKEELQRWVFAMWVGANGKNSTHTRPCGGTTPDEAASFIQAIFEENGDKHNPGKLRFDYIANKPVGLYFQNGDKIIDCSTYDRVNEHGLATKVTREFRNKINKHIVM